jgi:hypothetical protein
MRISIVCLALAAGSASASPPASVPEALEAKADAPDASAIPWLLLAAKSHAGEGALANVSFIERVATTGGKAPARGCDATRVDAEQRVPYTASYYFYTPR